MSDTTRDSEGMDRRKFLGGLALLSLGGTTVFSTAMVGRAVIPPGRSIEGKTKVGTLAVGKVSELVEEEPALVEYGDDVLFLMMKADGSVNVFDAACPHVACKLSWNPGTKEYDCPCHASSFDIDGVLQGGPAPRDMYAAEFEVVEDDIVVSSIIRA